MNRTTSLAAVALMSVSLLGLVTAPVAADDQRRHQREYEVTITNITRGQVFSPPILVTHKSSVRLFELGQPALDELASVAETGGTGALAELLDPLSKVGAVVATTAPIPPGESVTITVESSGRFRNISIAGMLVNTNDAFFAVDTQSLPRHGKHKRAFFALAYDAGSEANNEDCAFIPGPACAEGSGNLRDEKDAEGYVHTHSGVHGGTDLSAAAYTWLNPVARVVIERVD